MIHIHTGYGSANTWAKSEIETYPLKIAHVQGEANLWAMSR